MESRFSTPVARLDAPPTTEPSTDRMGSLTDRRDDSTRPHAAPIEEALVVDDRCGLSPAQAVENKLTRILKEATLPVSHLQMRGLLRHR